METIFGFGNAGMDYVRRKGLRFMPTYKFYHKRGYITGVQTHFARKRHCVGDLVQNRKSVRSKSNRRSN